MPTVLDIVQLPVYKLRLGAKILNRQDISFITNELLNSMESIEFVVGAIY